MRRICRLFAFACLLSALPLPASSTDWQPELPALRERAEARWQRLHQGGQPKPHADTREFMAYALDAVAAGGEDAARIQRALEIVRERQDRDPASKTYGNIRWYLDDTRVVDRNGVEFVVRHAALLWLLYRERLTPAQRAPLEEMLRLARTGITQHVVPVSYTNIFLMKAWNLIALGEGLEDAALATEGRRMLRDWLDYTARHGITEYLSPTYYAVDLECLALIHNLTRDDETRALAQRGLDAVWSDLALHWHAPAGRLGGVHSRDYNRLYNTGDINLLAARAGWPSAREARVEPGPYAHYAWQAPSARVEALRRMPLPRMIGTRWGEAAHARHWHYLAADFSLASSEANYHNMDTAPLAVNLGEGAEAPVITYTLDGRSDYYGLTRYMESGSGHLKSLHLRPFLASVQRGPEVLFLAQGGLENAFHHTLESTLILPADARYWLDGRPLPVFTQRSAWQVEPAANGSTTRVRVEAAQPRARVLLTDTDPQAGVGLSRDFVVSAGARYRLRTRLAGGELSLYLNFYDARGRLVGGERIQRAGGSAQARDYSFEQTAPDGAVRCRAWVYSPIAAQTQVELLDLAFERLGATGAEVLGDHDFVAHQAQQIAIPPGATLVVQRGTAALALRVLAARDGAGQTVPAYLYNDGLQHGALRLTALHGRREGARLPGKGVFALWARAAGALQDEAAGEAFRQQAQAVRTGQDREDETLELHAGPLRLRVDLTRDARLLRAGGDSLPEGQARMSNGQALPF